MSIGQLTPVPLREVWRHEAHNFTVWLSENLEFLADRLGMELTLIEREKNVGTFSADIVCEDGNGDSVLIENQLEKTDHDHLGKLITYMSNLDTKTAIWITSDPRPEHETAVNWLNETLPADTAFYLVKIEAFRIGDSARAPLFSMVAGPSEEVRVIGTEKKQNAEKQVSYHRFWTQLLEKARPRTQLHERISPGKYHWIGTSAGKSGISFNYIIVLRVARVELYINTDDAEQNERIFDELAHHREAIEKAFGGPIEWARLEGRRACRISYLVQNGGLVDENRWPEIQDEMVDAMVRLHNALKPHIDRL